MTWRAFIKADAEGNQCVYMQDGFGDLENEHGSWPATNLALVNSLKIKDYDFKMTWGNGSHSRNGGNVEMAEEMTWLWRGYDAGRTEETFVQDPAEAGKPPFRVSITNR